MGTATAQHQAGPSGDQAEHDVAEQQHGGQPECAVEGGAVHPEREAAQGGEAADEAGPNGGCEPVRQTGASEDGGDQVAQGERSDDVDDHHDHAAVTVPQHVDDISQ